MQMNGANLFSTRKRELSDAEYIEQVRDRVAKRDRLDRWYRRFAVALLLFAAGLFIYATQIIQHLNNIIPGAGRGFVVGAILGCKLMIVMMGAVHLTIIAFFADSRWEKLLLQYHDSLEQIRQLPQFQSPAADAGLPAVGTGGKLAE
jgi:hypothetical protein